MKFISGSALLFLIAITQVKSSQANVVIHPGESYNSSEITITDGDGTASQDAATLYHAMVAPEKNDMTYAKTVTSAGGDVSITCQIIGRSVDSHDEPHLFFGCSLFVATYPSLQKGHSSFDSFFADRDVSKLFSLNSNNGTVADGVKNSFYYGTSDQSLQLNVDASGVRITFKQ